MTYLTAISYSELTCWRSECLKRFGSILDLKIVPSPYSVALSLYNRGKVLDVGAGEERIIQKILNIKHTDYFSLDLDASSEFSFRRFTDIPHGLMFEMIVMNQFLEHLTLDDACTIIQQAYQVINPGGLLFISVPNASHPVRYHADVTHVTNWAFGDLYGLLRHAGFDVKNILRANKRSLSCNLFKRWIISVVCRELRVDWCDTIIMEARKPQ